MLYMVTFTINIPQMLAYIPYMDPMGHHSYHTLGVIFQDKATPRGVSRRSLTVLSCQSSRQTSTLCTEKVSTYPLGIQQFALEMHHFPKVNDGNLSTLHGPFSIATSSVELFNSSSGQSSCTTTKIHEFDVQLHIRMIEKPWCLNQTVSIFFYICFYISASLQLWP